MAGSVLNDMASSFDYSPFWRLMKFIEKQNKLIVKR